MHELTFVHYDLLETECVDPALYESVPAEILYQLYTEIIGHIPMAENTKNPNTGSSEADHLEAAGRHPLVRQYMLALSNLYAGMNTLKSSDEHEADEVRTRVHEISKYTAYGEPTQFEFEKLLKNFLRKGEYGYDVQARDKARQVSYAVGPWLLDHFDKDNWSRYTYQGVTKSIHADMVYLLLIEDLVSPDHYSEWVQLAAEIENIIESLYEYSSLFGKLSNRFSRTGNESI